MFFIIGIKHVQRAECKNSKVIWMKCEDFGLSDVYLTVDGSTALFFGQGLALVFIVVVLLPTCIFTYSWFTELFFGSIDELLYWKIRN